MGCTKYNTHWISKSTRTRAETSVFKSRQHISCQVKYVLITAAQGIRLYPSMAKTVAQV